MTRKRCIRSFVSGKVFIHYEMKNAGTTFHFVELHACF